MPLQQRIQAVATELRSIVLDGAAQRGTVRLHQSYADNYWTVTVYADGTTRYDNYAEEARGPRGSVNDLTLWELATLAEELQRS